MRFLVAVSALLVAERVLACSCPPPPEPKQAMANSAAVCLAEVANIETEGEVRTVTLKVEKWWKGGDKTELVVSTAKSGATCGYGFEKGKKYLVYARDADKGKPLHVSLCSRTRTAKEAEKSGGLQRTRRGESARGTDPGARDRVSEGRTEGGGRDPGPAHQNCLENRLFSQGITRIAYDF